jgi:spermidine synthase
MARLLVTFCIVLTGASSLVYEVVWLAQSVLVIGAATPAFSTVLAVFFGGLALGAWMFGRFSTRWRRPLVAYGILQLVLVGLGLAATAAFGPLDRIYGVAYRALGDQPGLLAVVRTLLIAAILLPPTVLMGGTLPLISRQFATDRRRVAGTVARLYALNTLGAALGCALAGFVLIPGIGLWGAALLAAAVDLLAAVGLLAARLPGPPAAAPETETGAAEALALATARRPRPPAGEAPVPYAWLVALLFALVGLTSLAGEVLWARFLTLLVHDTVHTWTVILTVVLTGIVLGAWLVGRLADRIADPALLLGGLMGLVAIVSLALPLQPVAFWQGLGEGTAPFVLVLLPPAVLAGACLPAALRLVARSPELIGLDVGRLAAQNTLGGIVGSLLAGFVLLPGLGLQVSLLLVSGLGLIGAVAGLVLLPGGHRQVRLVTAGGLCLAWLVVPLTADVRLPADYLAPRAQLVGWAEGRASTLAAIRRGDHLVLHVDRLWQGRDARNHQIVAAHIPALLHPAPHRVCVVGVGVGQTASRFLLHEVAQLDCVDIEPAIFPFIREYFTADWLDDPRVHAVADDGRTFVVHGRGGYDLVSIEAGQTNRPGVATFYTREFYTAVAARLAPGGLVSQFVPLTYLDQEMLRAVVATFLDVFPRSVLWYNTAELLLIGGKDLQLAADRLARVETVPELRDDLAYSHWGGQRHHLNQLGNLLGGFFCGPEALARLADGAPVLTDMHPRLAYVTRGADLEDRRELQLAPLLADLIESPGALLSGPVSEAVLARAAEIQALNLADLTAAVHVAAADRRRAAGDLAGAITELQEALRRNPQSVEAMRVLGDVLGQAGRAQEAARWLRRVLEQRPDDHLAARVLGAALVQLAELAEAEVLLREVVAARPADAAAWNALGAAIAGQGRPREAVPSFRRAVELDPDDRGARLNLQRALQESQR